MKKKNASLEKSQHMSLIVGVAIICFYAVALVFGLMFMVSLKGTPPSIYTDLAIFGSTLLMIAFMIFAMNHADKKMWRIIIYSIGIFILLAAAFGVFVILPIATRFL